jgi:putative transposase
VTRGIDDNLIFKDIDDYYRGIFSIYEFNTTKPITIQKRREARLRLKKQSRDPVSTVDEREKMVEVLAFCLMPNHVHLLVKQLKNNGITKFMLKFGAGYGGYFNRKYERKGYVFQDRFSTVHIKDDEQLKIVFVYIHTNPVSLLEPKWKEKGIKDSKKTIKFLEGYKWSSYLDYIGKKNFPSVINKEIVFKILGDERECKKFVESWIKYKKEIKKFANLALE